VSSFLFFIYTFSFENKKGIYIFAFSHAALYLAFTTNKPGPSYSLNLEIWPHFKNICPSLL